jgi:hypothetical protein
MLIVFLLILCIAVDKTKCTYKYRHFFRVYSCDVATSFSQNIDNDKIERERVSALKSPRCTHVTSIKDG